MRSKQAMSELRTALAALYEQREASLIADWVMEEITGRPRIDRLMHDNELDPGQEQKFHACTSELITGKPVQYVLGYGWFMGYRFLVNESVLIPRPETEELVQWLTSELGDTGTILDIGTGSGCIPIMIKKLKPKSVVHTIDISPAATDVARSNAKTMGTEIFFHVGNFLDEASWSSLPSPDIIISNPPYIPYKDMQSMHRNVVEHEPHLALFVPDEDALIFYRKIIAFAKQKGTGKIYLETHYQLAHAVSQLGKQNGYEAEIRKDLAGNERMILLDHGS